jgi:hypothetical protein
MVQDGLDKKYETLSPKYPQQKSLEMWLKELSICLASTKPWVQTYYHKQIK